MKPEIIIPIGIAGSGKTTHFRKYYAPYFHISADDIRFRILNSEKTGIFFDASIEEQVWKDVFSNLTQAIEKNLNIYFDSTNLTIERRKKIISYLNPQNYRIHFIMFQISELNALKNDRKRQRHVEPSVIHDQYLKYEPLSFDELTGLQQQKFLVKTEIIFP